jgi:hypothetical protein
MLRTRRSAQAIWSARSVGRDYRLGVRRVRVRAPGSGHRVIVRTGFGTGPGPSTGPPGILACGGRYAVVPELVNRCRCHGCQSAARQQQVRRLPQPAGTAPGHQAPRSSMSSSSPCRPVDTQGPRPGNSTGMRPSIQSRTQQLMDRDSEHLAVLIRKAAEVHQEAGSPDVLHSSGPRSASSASIESYTFPSGTSSPVRDGYLAS